MGASEAAGTFEVAGEAYDRFMGRYSRELAAWYADAVGVAAGQRVLDVGCGPGALTDVLVSRLGADGVLACDPSASFRDAAVARFPGVEVALAGAEELPFADDAVDHAMAQLVLHFVTEPERAVREMSRVVRPGGTVSACVWDFEVGMQMLRAYWDAALVVDPAAPDEARTLRFGGAGEIAALLTDAGFLDVTETTLTVSTTYASFDELWEGFLLGVGPAGAHCVGLAEDQRAELRALLHTGVGAPAGAFQLDAVARLAVGHVPG